jgi:hypothetical protein
MLQIYRYRSRRLFKTDNRGGGVNDIKTYTVKTAAVGKAQWNESPYLLANEWISAQIAQALRLPVPSFAIVQKKTPQSRMFISYDYEGDTSPDDVEPDLFYRACPFEATGVVVFDILVSNCDRHAGNLKVDRPSAPRSFYLIDHERALFYIYKGEGLRRLKSREDRLGVTDSSDSKDEWHCLVELIDSVEHLKAWASRVEQIPDWFIDEICEEVRGISISKTECEAVRSFLKARKKKFAKLIFDHKDRFPLVPKNDWGLFL